MQADFEIPVEAASGDGALVVRLRRDSPRLPLVEGDEPAPPTTPFAEQRIPLRVD